MELKAEIQQKMALSVHMQQCLEILDMDNAQLGEFIIEQAMENPMLEFVDRITWVNDKSTVIRMERDCSGIILKEDMKESQKKREKQYHRSNGPVM